jgi:hypothetical protein
MNLNKILACLYARKQILDRAITALEKMLETGQPSSFLKPPSSRRRRGRQSMGNAERLQVSARMKRYWADRRKTQQAARPVRAPVAPLLPGDDDIGPDRSSIHPSSALRSESRTPR